MPMILLSSSSAIAIGSDRNAILRRLVIKGIPGRGYRVVGGRANRTRISAELQSVFRYYPLYPCSNSPKAAGVGTLRR